MQVFVHRNVWMPLLLLSLVFLVEKVFFLRSVREVLQPIGALEADLYESRERLFVRLQEESQDRRGSFGLILGSSRSMSLASGAFEAQGTRPVYNFSAPATGPGYFCYWLERSRAVARIDSAIVEFDTSLLSYEAGRLALAHSYDLDFMWRHYRPAAARAVDIWADPGQGSFGSEQVEGFLLKKAFGTARFPPDPMAAFRNYRERTAFVPGQGLVRFRRIDAWPLARARIRASVLEQRGGFPDSLSFQEHVLDLQSHAERTARRFERFQADPAQIYFLDRLINILAEDGTPTIFYWPMATTHLYRTLGASGYNAPYRRKLESLLARARVLHPQARLMPVDYNDRMRCRNFSDSFHLAGACVPELVQRLVVDLARVRAR